MKPHCVDVPCKQVAWDVNMHSLESPCLSVHTADLGNIILPGCSPVAISLGFRLTGGQLLMDAVRIL